MKPSVRDLSKPAYDNNVITAPPQNMKGAGDVAPSQKNLMTK